MEERKSTIVRIFLKTQNRQINAIRSKVEIMKMIFFIKTSSSNTLSDSQRNKFTLKFMSITYKRKSSVLFYTVDIHKVSKIFQFTCQFTRQLFYSKFKMVVVSFSIYWLSIFLTL